MVVEGTWLVIDLEKDRIASDSKSMLKPRIHRFSPAYPEYQEHVFPQDFVQQVEKAKYISLAEKIELLALFLGKKMTTEISMNIPFSLEDSIEKADKTFLLHLEEELQHLELPYFCDTYTKLNRTSGIQREFVWFQVSRNQVVNDYLQKNDNQLSDADYGVLYGFPTTAIQAFLGFIPSSTKASPTIGCFSFGGIFSRDHIDKELKYYDDLWTQVAALSPTIAQQAELKYQEYLTT